MYTSTMVSVAFDRTQEQELDAIGRPQLLGDLQLNFR
jgi:hypothetical protein